MSLTQANMTRTEVCPPCQKKHASASESDTETTVRGKANGERSRAASLSIFDDEYFDAAFDGHVPAAQALLVETVRNLTELKPAFFAHQPN